MPEEAFARNEWSGTYAQFALRATEFNMKLNFQLTSHREN